MKTPLCPKCNKEAKRTETRYGPRHDCCGLWSWDEAPLVDAETHDLRKKAHSTFDTLWKKHGMKRSDAYFELSKKLNIEPKDCHMKLMDKSTLLKVPKACLEILYGGNER